MDETSEAVPAGMEIVTMAPGRSISTGHVIGYDQHGGPTIETEVVKPGKSRLVTVEEAKQLRLGGFVVNPSDPLQA